MEKDFFWRLLVEGFPLIWCPAWGLDGILGAKQAGGKAPMVSPVLQALEENRLLILEMRNRDGNLAAAEQRNRFVLEHADRIWVPNLSPNGMLARLVHELCVQDKII